MKKRKQHYVWEHYLTAWADGSVLYCDRNGRRFAASTDNVASERDFYRVQELTESDLTYVTLLAQNLPEPGSTVAMRWISIFQTPFHLYRRYQEGRLRSDEFEAAFDESVNNLEEDVHAKFEAKALPLLAKLKQLNAEPIFDDREGVDAAMFLALQYLRTPGMARQVTAVSTDGLPGFNLSASWGVLRTIYGTSFGAGLYARRSSMRITFLHPAPERNFITGDQPLINTRGAVSQPVPVDIELYYPLTPRLGMLISFDVSPPTSCERQLSSSQTHDYNRLIAEARDQQLYAASAKDFDEILSNP